MPEAIAKRLELYEKDTAPLLGFYRERGLLATVDGNQDVAKVSSDIDAVLADRGLV
jgi:adenylate kinase